MIATNRNDVLHRLLSSGAYARQALEKTLSPSMDITVSSNFERLLFDLYRRDAGAVAALMAAFDKSAITLSERAMGAARERFDSARVDDGATAECIADTWNRCAYLLDPHSAIGLCAARAARRVSRSPGSRWPPRIRQNSPRRWRAPGVGSSRHCPRTWPISLPARSTSMCCRAISLWCSGLWPRIWAPECLP